MASPLQHLSRLRQRALQESITGAHALDVLIALLSRRSKVFSLGWGDEAFLAALPAALPKSDMSVISLTWHATSEHNGIARREGSFLSPLTRLPVESRTVHLRAWLRKGNQSACVILAGSHDEGYTLREHVFGGLASRGVDLYLMQNPYYGRRRIAGGLSAIKVSDHAMMALGMVLEARALLRHLRPEYLRVAVAGYSMGGHMAAIVAAVTPFPVACVALATGASASSIYTRGLMSWSVDFDALGRGLAERTAAQRRLHEFFNAADITNYPPPLRTDAAIILGCTRDGYVLRSETERLHRHWPGSGLRWLGAGHFSALLTGRHTLRDCIAHAIERL